MPLLREPRLPRENVDKVALRIGHRASGAMPEYSKNESTIAPPYRPKRNQGNQSDNVKK